MISCETLQFKDRRAWRAWLETNHAASPGIWLKFYKKETGKLSVRYPEALEEALCFGWIDSLVKRVDAETYIQKFSPRSDKSNWSEKNLGLVEGLRARGMMSLAGEAAVAKWRNRNPDSAGHRREAAAGAPEIPDFLLMALKKRPPALKNFRGLAPGYRRLYLLWILDGKREETRHRRAAEAAERIRRNLTPGLK